MITHSRLRPAGRIRFVGRVRALPRLAWLLGYVAATLACSTVLVAGSAVAGAGIAVAEPTPAPAPGVPDPGVRPSPNPDPTTPGSTPSPIGPPPTTTPTPAPSTPTPNPSQGPTPPGWNPAAPDSADDPGLFDIPGQIRKAINDFFAWVVEGALNPVLSALGEAVLTTPDLPGDERVRTMWTTSLVVANAVFVLFIVVAGIIVAGRETLQSSYGLKEIAPRLAVAGVLTNTSLLLTGKAIEFTNAVTAAIAGQGVDPNAAAAALTQALSEARNGDSFLLTLMVLGVLVMAIVVVFTFVLRIAFLAILLGIAPFALICHGLPQTEQLAFTWWRAFAACLGIQVGQAAVLLATLRMFLTPAGDAITGPGFMVGIPTPSRLVSILVVAAMVWLLLKIPGWMRTFVLGPLGRSGGRGLVGQIVHTIVMIKTLGAVAGLTRGGAAAGRAATRATRRAATAGRTTGPRRAAPTRTTPGPARTASRRGTGGRAGAPAPAMFSSAPASHTPLPQPAGTSGPVAFSHPPTPSRAAGRPPSGGGVPPVQFSHPPTATPPPRRPTAARPAPARFSNATGPAGSTPAAGRPATPAAAPVFSSAPRPQTAPKRPPTPGSTPVFSAAPKPVPPARRNPSRARSTPPPASTPAPPARATPGAAPARRPSPPASRAQPPAPPPTPPARRRPPRSDS